MNYVNSAYLLIIIFYGMLIFYSFALRIFDDKPFNATTEEIYPSWILVIGGFYLISCNIAIFCNKQEPILLFFNSATGITVALGLLNLISRRNENRTDRYPFLQIVVFSVIIALNFLISIFRWRGDSIGNIIKQSVSGGVIFLTALSFIVYLNRKQNQGTWKYYIKINTDIDELTKEKLLEELNLFDDKWEKKAFNSPEELNEWIIKIDVSLSKEVNYYIEGHYSDGKI